jgi:hypothetical protein
MPDLSPLIQRWQEGFERAAEAIYNHHQDATFRLAYGTVFYLCEAPSKEAAEAVHREAHGASPTRSSRLAKANKSIVGREVKPAFRLFLIQNYCKSNKN